MCESCNLEQQYVWESCRLWCWCKCNEKTSWFAQAWTKEEWWGDSSTFNAYEHFKVNIPIEAWSHILLCCIKDQVLMFIAS